MYMIVAIQHKAIEDDNELGKETVIACKTNKF